MDIRNFFFKYRSYTPIPLALLIIYFARPQLPYFWLGFIILAIGELIRMSAVRYAGGVTRTTKVGAPKLCTSGPFAHVRNPLYIGNICMYTGIVLIAGAPFIPGMLVLVWAFFIIQYSLIVSLEEETLVGLFGDEYLEYQKNVPRLIPRLKAWASNDDRVPMSLAKTIKTEKRTLQNVVAIILLILLRSQISSFNL